MSEPKDIIRRDDSSNRLNLYRTAHDRTLSEEYNSNSPDSKARIKSMCGTSPTSNVTDASPSKRMSVIGKLRINTQYKECNEYEREIMAHYGLVSTDFHNKNKDDKN